MSDERTTKARFRTSALGTAMALCLAPALARADDAVAYQKAVDLVVCVLSIGSNGELSSGTGVVTRCGIVTAKHVLQPGGTVLVVYAERDATGAVIGNRGHYADVHHLKRCVVVGASAERDLALLRLVAPEKGPVSPLAPASARPGEQVFSIGAGAETAMWHYTSGAVRQIYQGGFRADGGGVVRGRIIETTAPVNPGDSGGPLFNSAGELLGIILATETTSNQVHKSIDVSEVRAFLIETLEAELKELSKQQK